MQKIIEHKYEKLKEEFLFGKLDSRLLIIIYALAGYVYNNFGKTIMITDIFRPQERQNEYRKTHPEEPEFSPHTFWRAIDISIKYYTDDEIKKIMDFLAQFEYGSGKYKTAVNHDVLGIHIHIQVSNNDYTKVVKI